MNFNKIVVGFSSGADSVCLLYKVREQFPESTIVVAHLNHGINPKSDEWEELARTYAKHFGLEFVSQKENLKDCDGNLENTARQLRYSFFESLMDKNTVLVTGHHKNDMMETVLMKLFRGSGIDGLSGIMPYGEFGPGTIMRPLLNMSKTEIYEFCELNAEFGWVEDESNDDSSYDRNYLRNELIPMIEARWPKAVDGVAKSAQNLRDTKELIKEATDDTYNSVKIEYFGLNALKTDELKKHSRYMQSMMVKRLISDAWLHTNSNVIEKVLTDVLNSTDLGSKYDVGDYSIQKDRIKVGYEQHEVLILLPRDYFKGDKHIISFGDFRLNAEDYRVGEFIYVPKSTKIRINLKTKKIVDIYSSRKIPLFLRDNLPILFTIDGPHIIIPRMDKSKGYELIRYSTISND